MRKSLVALTTLLILGSAAPLWGGTVYVPYAVNRTVRGHMFTTEIRVHNDDNEAHTLTYLFIPVGKNGVNFDRSTEPVEVIVPGHVTIPLVDLVPDGERGMVEINADPEIAVTARLIGSRDGGATKNVGVEIPAVTSSSTIPPGKAAIIQGLNRTAGRAVTDLYIATLSIERTQCAVEVRKRGGAEVIEQVLSLAPLSLTPFYDVLGLLAIDNASDMSVAITCDRIARPFAVTHDLETAELLFIPPSATGSSSLNPFPTSSCPTGALFSRPGVFHVPTPGNPSARYDINLPGRQTFSKITLDMEFTHGGWNRRSSDNHSVFWLNRDDVWRSNLVGYFNLFGPNRNFGKLISNLNLPAAVVRSVQQNASFQEGETYVVHYDYDTRSRVVELVMSVKGGQEMIRLQDTPTVSSLAADHFYVVFGHVETGHGPEVTTFGWAYSDLCIQVE
ncbi:MAG TPA: hypothetical protein VGG06_21605 [Thermoanaerobaculia bacterium]|jgi:hypothetical protein